MSSVKRYSDQELEGLLNDIESDRVERKRAFKNEGEDARQVVCAFSNDLPFDLHPIGTSKIDDLSRVIFENEYLPAAFSKEILDANNRSYAERLSSCRMIVSPDDTTPTILGLLTLGKNPYDFIPGSYIQFLRINGTELFDPITDEEEIKGTLPDIIRRTEEKLKAHNRTAVDISSVPQITTIDYPHIAFQQILLNAVMHRSYEGTNAPVRVNWFNDRVEIISPGGPFGIVTVENFGNPGIIDYRNPNIAEMFKTLGLVQRYGIGIQTAQNEMKRNGNPPINFISNQSVVICVLRSKKQH